MANLDADTVAGFGDEWTRFDQSALPEDERKAVFALYFRVFPWEALPPAATGFDLGCGSGRWACEVAPRVGTLHCVDASSAAVKVARKNLAGYDNCIFHVAGVDRIPLPDGSMDFGYSLGVLHHVPDTQAALRACVAKLKPGAPFLIYLYSAFRQSPGLVPRPLAGQRPGPPGDLAAALSATGRDQPGAGDRGLFPAGAGRGAGRTPGLVGGRAAPRGLPAPQFLHHADRCAGPLRYPPGAALYGSPDPGAHGAGRVGTGPLFAGAALLVRGGVPAGGITHPNAGSSVKF